MRLPLRSYQSHIGVGHALLDYAATGPPGPDLSLLKRRADYKANVSTESSDRASAMASSLMMWQVFQMGSD
jgi:hypothetical protein